MAGNQMSYSGLVTKTRAMSGVLLTSSEITNLMELTSVDETIGFLKGTRGYGAVFQEREEWHRGQAEAVIVNSLYRDLKKLYQFADARQRQAFQYVFFRYETDVLKRFLKGVFGRHQEEELHISPFFYQHARYSIEDIKKASTLTEFEQALAGSPYEKVFLKTHMSERQGYADFAMELDIFYYVRVYKDIQKMRSGQLKEILKAVYGTQIDWLNLMWIYRSKRFYSQTPAELFASLIPCYYRLKKEEVLSLIAAPGLPELNQILMNTYYFKGKEAFVKMEDAISFRGVMDAVYRRVSQKYPMSPAPVLRYLFQKEQEIERLITIIEGIRYQIPAKEMKDLILITI